MGHQRTFVPLTTHEELSAKEARLLEQLRSLDVEAIIINRRHYDARMASEQSRKDWVRNLPLYEADAAQIIEQRGGDPED